MSDGIGCVCAARSEYECCCDADWRPQELIDLQQQLASRDAEIEGHKGRFAKDQDRIACQAEQLAQKNAEIAELVAALELLSKYIAYNGDDWVQRTALEALAKVRKP